MNIIIGNLLIFLAFIIALIYLILKLPKPGLAITVCFLMVFTGIFFIIQERATKLVFPGIAEVELAVEKANSGVEIIDSLKTQMENDANKVSELKEKLGKMFKLNASGEIDVMRTLNTGLFEFTVDSGLVTAMNMPVSSEPKKGSKMGYVFSIDSNNILGVISEANGIGGVENKKIFGYGDYEMENSDNGIIFKSPNGYKWKLTIDNMGDFKIEKL